MLPSITDKKWEDLLLGKLNVSPGFLGISVVLGLASIELKRDSSSKKLEELKIKVRDAFVKHQHLPAVKDDIKKIFG